MQTMTRESSWRIYTLLLGISALLVLSFYSLDLQLHRLFSERSWTLMSRFFGELLSPNLDPAFLQKVLVASLETIAMSALGTLIAAILGIFFALSASKTHSADPARLRTLTRLLLNALRSIPELVWAALILISVGLGPFAGTLALALHTSGVLGRLFAESIENAPPHCADSLRSNGLSELNIFLYATLPTVLPQLISYTLYRWENNIRAAAVLGVVGGGGLGQMLSFHMGLFQMQETSTLLLSMIILVMLVDGLSYWIRKALAQ
ncbi:MAG: phosphonate ABC transporter, permease protein PhnE [Burkholderiaceae bacterium]|nr:phosphonate ABC transporter, permease protein PhnE [Burkholderiaceae bacterium]